MADDKNDKKFKKVRQVAAIVAIVLLVGMYVVTLIAALTASESANALFTASLFSSLVIPIMLYVFIMFYKWTHRDKGVSLNKFRKMKGEIINDAQKEAENMAAEDEGNMSSNEAEETK